MNEDNQTKHWYAVYVRSRHEKVVQQLFEEKGVESFLPLLKKVKRWSDRKKIIYEPLFRGYVFVHIDINSEKFSVLQTEGVVKFIGIKLTPSIIPDKQMLWINILLKEPTDVAVEKSFPVGECVKVIAGNFKGLEGVVQQKRGKSRLVVWIDAVMNGLSVVINPGFLTKLRKRK